MTSLRTFQNQIEEIHAKETLKQRAQAAAERDKDKENKAHTRGKGKEIALTVAESEPQVQEDPLAESDVEIQVRTISRNINITSSGVLNSVRQRLLLSGAAEDHNQARDLIAALLTRHRGEYIFRIGARPPNTAPLSGEALKDGEAWSGIARNGQEISLLQQEITATVEEVGGKVYTSYT